MINFLRWGTIPDERVQNQFSFSLVFRSGDRLSDRFTRETMKIYKDICTYIRNNVGIFGMHRVKDT